MQIEDGEVRYVSYLLRAWQETSGGSDVWVYEMECIQTGQKLTFANLQALYDYLKEQQWSS
jgi:hypothetical protein